MVHTLEELLSENEELLLGTEFMNEEFIKHITDCMHSQHCTQLLGAHFVDVLRVCCSLDGVPIPANQCLILDYTMAAFMEVTSEHNRLDIRQTTPLSLFGAQHSTHLSAYYSLHTGSFHHLRYSSELRSSSTYSCGCEQRNDNPLSRVRISASGDVEISCPSDASLRGLPSRLLSLATMFLLCFFVPLFLSFYIS